MKTGIGLAFVCVGAILAFAVTTNTSVFNLHTAGWVIMLVGVIGLLLPRRTYGWLGRRMVRRTYPASQAEEVTMPAHVTRDPGTSRVRAGLTGGPTVPGDPAPDVPGATVVVPGATVRPASQPETEVIEDIYEE